MTVIIRKRPYKPLMRKVEVLKNTNPQIWMVIELTCNVLGGQTIQEDEDNDKE